MAQPTTVEELKNNEVSVTIRKFPHCKVELEVTTGEALIKKANAEALKAVKKEVTIPGFRKGKAPDDMIVKSYSASIHDKAQKSLADLAFLSAQNLVKIPLLNNNSSIQFRVSKEGGKESVLIFTFETEPTVPAIDSKNFTLRPVDAQQVGEKELNEAIRQMQLFYAKWTPVTDRKVKEDDFIVIDLKSLEEPPQTIFSDTRFEVNDAHMAKWMKKLVLGKENGAAVEGFSEPDSDLPEDKKKEFQAKRVLLTIKKIETAELSELNDDFAKKVGAKDLEHMKKYLMDMLQQKAIERVDHEKRDQVNDFLLSFTFELPLTLIQKEKSHRRKQYEQDPRYQAKLQQMTPLQQDMEKLELEEAIQNQSEAAVRLFYASREIVRENKINVSYDEVQQEAIRTLSAFGPVRTDISKIPEEVFALALSKIILMKAQDFILR